jgi:hemolysin activation/secretion protein
LTRSYLLSILLCLFAPFYIYGTGLEPYIDNQEVITKELKGLIISGDHLYPPEYILKTTKGALFYRTSPADNMSDQVVFLKNLERRIVGKPITYSDIEKYKEEIAAFYLKYCNKYVFVELLRGGLDSTILVLKVMESKVGEILVTGNNWFSEEFYKKNIGLFPNGIVNNQKLQANVNRINRSPWSKAEVIYRKGKNKSEIDVELQVKDSKPVQFYSGANNSGVEVLGSSRMFAGAVWRGSFLKDQTLSFEYEVAPSFKNLASYTLDYTLPLKQFGGCRFKCNYSGFHTVNNAAQEGAFFASSTKYELPLAQTIRRVQNLSIGVDLKTMDNNFLSGGIIRSPDFATIFRMSSVYSGGYCSGVHEISGEIGAFAQPLSASKSMSAKVYSELRQGAATTYAFSKAAIIYNYTPEDKRSPSLKVRLEGQISSARLLPAEQFGLGGINSVRGYVERAVNVDNGLFASVEGQTPKFSLLKYVAKKYRNYDKFYGVLFVDGGHGSILDPEKGESRSAFLLGVGPGLRYDLFDSIYSRLDLGVRLGGIPESSSYDSRVRVYFTVGGSY